MSIIDKPGTQAKNPSLSEDLTVILLRGNGSPRTFRLSLPALQRSLTALGFLFTFAVLAAILLLALNLYRPAVRERVVEVPASVSSGPAATAPADTKPAFWKNLTGKGDEGKSQEELRAENEALRADLTRLSGLADNRKELPAGQLPGLLQFFGPRNVEEGISPIAVKNIRVTKGDSAKEIYVDFELHNVDPEQRTARGYIVVLAKTQSILATYPEGALSPNQSIVLDYTKGETFGVSRFREARATFRAAPLEGLKPRFQVLLFANDGRVINNLHVENTP